MDRHTSRKDGTLVHFPVGTGAVIYGGHIVCANAAGFAVPGGPDVALTVLGIADEMVDNATGADGVVTVPVYRGKSFCLANSTATPVTQAMVGKDCYIADSVTVSAMIPDAVDPTLATTPVAGKVLEVTPDGVWVLI